MAGAGWSHCSIRFSRGPPGPLWYSITKAWARRCRACLRIIGGAARACRVAAMRFAIFLVLCAPAVLWAPPAGTIVVDAMKRDTRSLEKPTHEESLHEKAWKNARCAPDYRPHDRW